MLSQEERKLVLWISRWSHEEKCIIPDPYSWERRGTRKRKNF
jgi:hypothetical protein